MNITPERAIELAEQIELALREGEFVDEGLAEATDCAAILRHYAEILPKWQAVLDAEVAACMDPETGDFAHGGPSGSWSVPLIIKPAP